MLLFTFSVAAKEDNKPKLPDELQHVADLAEAAPPEFTSDALLRIGAVAKVDKSLRIELIERAFHLAMSAEFASPLKLARPATDTLESMTVAASKLGLDRLSLQIRAVNQMLPLDPKAARTLFLQIEPPEAPSCTQPILPDAGPLYSSLIPLAGAVFPPDERDGVVVRLNGALQSAQPSGCDAASTASPATTVLWNSDAAKRIYEHALKLRNGDDGATPRSAAQRSTPEWFQQLTDFLSALGGWSPSDEKSEAIYYHEKAVVYEMLVELTPPGRERDRLIQSCVDFMARSNLQQDRPVEWFFHSRTLIERLRNSSSADVPKILAAFENSGNPVLLLYAALDKAGLPAQ